MLNEYQPCDFGNVGSSAMVGRYRTACAMARSDKHDWWQWIGSSVGATTLSIWLAKKSGGLIDSWVADYLFRGRATSVTIQTQVPPPMSTIRQQRSRGRTPLSRRLISLFPQRPSRS
jgi:hypothetical protein